MKWIEAGPQTWHVGHLSVYRAQLPGDVFFVGPKNSSTPRQRFNTKEEALAYIKQELGAPNAR
jgi:hypothetical protein